jgi:tRNA(fMet)-specific endonuclease VapC
MSGYLLDTDTCSHHFRGSQSVTQHASNHADELYLSAVTLAELLTWTLWNNAPPKWHRLLLRFLDAAQVLPVTPQVAERCGQVRAEMYDRGHAVPVADMLIASTALVHNLTLVTHNTTHFVTVPGLILQDWVTP